MKPSQYRMAITFHRLAQRSGQIAATYFPHPFEGKYFKESAVEHRRSFQRIAEQSGIRPTVLEERITAFLNRRNRRAIAR